MQFANPIVNRIVIFGSGDGLPDITIGPNPVITMYNGTDIIIRLGVFGGDPNPQFVLQNTLGDSLKLQLGTFPGGDNPSIRYDTNAGESASIYMSALGNGFVHQMVPSGGGDQVQILMRENPVSSNLEVTTNHVVLSIAPGTTDTSETWHNIAGGVGFQNGWADLNPIFLFAPVAYRLMPDGTVLYRGLAAAGTTADGTVLFTVPADYRPAFKQQVTANTNVANKSIRLQFFTNGQVQIFDLATAPAGNVVSFDMVRIPLGVLP